MAQIFWSVGCGYLCHYVDSGLWQFVYLLYRCSSFRCYWVAWSVGAQWTIPKATSSIKTALISNLANCFQLGLQFCWVYRIHHFWNQSTWKFLELGFSSWTGYLSDVAVTHRIARMSLGYHRGVVIHRCQF